MPNKSRPRSWAHNGGYRSMRYPEHPIAPPSGKVLEHRVVLFDEIGEGPHLCGECGTPVSWNRQGRHALFVDHVNAHRSDNRIENLRPLCRRCNDAQGKSKITHCPQGHPYDEENTYLYESARGVGRYCRACMQARRKSHSEAI